VPVPLLSPQVVEMPKAPPAALVAQDINTACVLGTDVAVVEVALAEQDEKEVCAATAIAKPVA
jgi:hypothetical protein